MLSLVASGDELVQLTDKIFKRRERQLNSQQCLLTVYVLTKFWPKIQNCRKLEWTDLRTAPWTHRGQPAPRARDTGWGSCRSCTGSASHSAGNRLSDITERSPIGIQRPKLVFIIVEYTTLGIERQIGGAVGGVNTPGSLCSPLLVYPLDCTENGYFGHFVADVTYLWTIWAFTSCRTRCGTNLTRWLLFALLSESWFTDVKSQ